MHSTPRRELERRATRGRSGSGTLMRHCSCNLLQTVLVVCGAVPIGRSSLIGRNDYGCDCRTAQRRNRRDRPGQLANAPLQGVGEKLQKSGKSGVEADEPVGSLLLVRGQQRESPVAIAGRISTILSIASISRRGNIKMGQNLDCLRSRRQCLCHRSLAADRITPAIAAGL